jgi:hypothetical protein
VIFYTVFRTNLAVYQPGFEGGTLSAAADFTFLRNVSRVTAPPQ